MSRAILGPISEDRLYRLHLWGGDRPPNSGGGGMDEYIGRTAHVSFNLLRRTYGKDPLCDVLRLTHFENNAYPLSNNTVLLCIARMELRTALPAGDQLL